MQAQSEIRDPQPAIAKRLLLFDIDGTLVHSGGAGMHALKGVMIYAQENAPKAQAVKK